MSSSNNIIRQPVKSSNISEVGYDPLMHNMIVKFHNGTVYEYVNVPKEVFDEIIKASSVGKYFQTNVRTKYDYLKIG